MKKKVLIVIGCFIAILALTIAGARSVYNDHPDFFNMFKSFTVRIDNQSDFDFVAIEAGILQSGNNGDIVETGSKDTLANPLASGDKVTFKPKLSIQGEGGIYLKVTDSSGRTETYGICSYTESLSGQTDVTVSNDGVKIDQNCY
ncbi:hypothetical protein B1748_12390 [Paenibacillus sp. MY03]|uniref:Uncharacterized protein n=1 Tax=Paenibacillus agaridevorans TaxID=171404 RepID=A0A2R5EJT8_9BACL|nr:MULTISPECIES: hypothetical protein [Paenibacillus]OUS76471.1 hypothetical protein B1748_12390 [Paenibacillus sp. MY03]GBG06886.1 hypothetical protein PAT3040_01427 [Paenibacillus agaridevorans]